MARLHPRRRRPLPHLRLSRTSAVPRAGRVHDTSTTRPAGNLSELVECDEDPDCRNEMRAALPDDLFMSVQTRHAGFALYSLANENTPVLAMYMLAMMMAPVPLMIAVHSSSRRVSGRAHGTDEAAAREVDDGGGPAEPLTVAERLAGHRWSSETLPRHCLDTPWTSPSPAAGRSGGRSAPPPASACEASSEARPTGRPRRALLRPCQTCSLGTGWSHSSARSRSPSCGPRP